MTFFGAAVDCDLLGVADDTVPRGADIEGLSAARRIVILARGNATLHIHSECLLLLNCMGSILKIQKQCLIKNVICLYNIFLLGWGHR